MAKHGARGSGSGRSRKHGGAWAITAAAIGGAGMVLAAPATALLIGPAVAQAAPPPVVDPLCPLVGSCAGGSLGASIAGVLGPAGLADPFGLPTDLLGFAGAIPVLNIFIGNGADGTALHPDGFNGGDGGPLGGNGGNGGVGANGTPSFYASDGGNGGGVFGFGNGGTGGAGGSGGTP